MENSQNQQTEGADVEDPSWNTKIWTQNLQSMMQIVKITNHKLYQQMISYTIDIGDICLQIKFVLKKWFPDLKSGPVQWAELNMLRIKTCKPSIH
jgi:hypothetical protein